MPKPNRPCNKLAVLTGRLEVPLSPRTRSTFAKRQKEQARQEKQRAKAQRKLQRKMESQTRSPEDDAANPETPSDTQPEAPSEFGINSTANPEV